MMTASHCYWLPRLPDPTGAIRLARSLDGSPADRLREPSRIARHDLDFLQLGKLDRCLTEVLSSFEQAVPGYPSLRLAWLASSTVEHLLPAVRVAAFRHGLIVTCRAGDYGQYRQELLGQDSWLATFEPDVVLITLDPADAAPQVPISASPVEASDAVQARVDELRALWRAARTTYGAAVIQQTIPNLAPPAFGSFDAVLPAAPRNLTHALNASLCRAAATEGVHVCDLDGAASYLGQATFFDPVRWHHAKQLVSPALAPRFGELVGRSLAALRGTSRKCLVLDLDNTLWGGVVGDDGPDGILVGPGTAAGEAFQAFQHYVKALSDRGVLLAVCSKNDHATAENAFVARPEMALKREDFAAFVANWDDKAGNIRNIAAALDIGLDSLVFFDDNPAERRLVRQELPMVAVPEVPEEPALFPRCIADAGYFEAVSFTADDRARAKQYAENARRLQARQSATDLPAFLRGLNMELIVGPVAPANLPRVVQLINKTNQFNLRTQRYTDADVLRMIEDPDVLCRQFRLTDTLGDNGLISVVIATPVGSDAYFIDTWLMSCRVLGRQVEEEVLNVIASEARAQSRGQLIGEYIPTRKNGLVSDLFSRLAFRPLAADPLGTTRWLLDLEDYAPRETHITTRYQDG